MSAPYYADDKVTLYLGDCREVTEWLSADVLVTDPPYGMAFTQGRRVNGQASAWTSRWTDVKIAGDDTTQARDEILAAWGDRPALVLGRRAIGVELEERYCEVIAKRLAQDVLDFGGAS